MYWCMREITVVFFRNKLKNKNIEQIKNKHGFLFLSLFSFNFALIQICSNVAALYQIIRHKECQLRKFNSLKRKHHSKIDTLAKRKHFSSVSLEEVIHTSLSLNWTVTVRLQFPYFIRCFHQSNSIFTILISLQWTWTDQFYKRLHEVFIRLRFVLLYQLLFLKNTVWNVWQRYFRQYYLHNDLTLMSWKKASYTPSTILQEEKNTRGYQNFKSLFRKQTVPESQSPNETQAIIPKHQA